MKGGKRDGRKKRKKPPTGRRKLDEIDEATLPVVRVPVTDPVFEQLVAEGKAKRIGVETSSKIGYERGGFRRVVTERATYAARVPMARPSWRRRRCRPSCCLVALPPRTHSRTSW